MSDTRPDVNLILDTEISNHLDEHCLVLEYSDREYKLHHYIFEPDYIVIKNKEEFLEVVEALNILKKYEIKA